MSKKDCNALCVYLGNFWPEIEETLLAKHAGISFGRQMHGLVVLDEKDEVIRPAILWNDGRTAKETAFLNEVIGGRGVYVLLRQNKEMKTYDSF